MSHSAKQGKRCAVHTLADGDRAVSQKDLAMGTQNDLLLLYNPQPLGFYPYLAEHFSAMRTLGDDTRGSFFDLYPVKFHHTHIVLSPYSPGITLRLMAALPAVVMSKAPPEFLWSAA